MAARASAGRIVDGQAEYIASFPGVHFREWGRVTLVMIDRSVACVFVPGGSPLYGDHDEDPDHPGRCFCQSFLRVLWAAVKTPQPVPPPPLSLAMPALIPVSTPH